MITKSKMEKMCRNAHMDIAARGNVRGHEIFIADGFSMLPGVKFRKFGAEPGDPPAFVTLWFAVKGEETLDIGRALFFEDDEGFPARRNAALKDANDSIVALEQKRDELKRLH